MKNALVISSNTKAVQSISQTLSANYKVKNTASIETAFQIHGRTPFDIVCIDLAPPEIASACDPFEKAIRPFKNSNPQVQFVMVVPKEGFLKAIQSAPKDSFGILTHPVQETKIKQVFESAEVSIIKDFELDYLRGHFWKTDWLNIVYSRNSIMQKVYENIRTVAPTLATVLLLGETGTGKGLLARLLHWHSNRNDQPFIAVHCGAIPETLIESDLFGHEKGAYTGADRRKYGKFEIANSGTIFLDEIGTISSSVQIKLLQVIQDGTFSRVGGNEQLKTNARIIAATNADLKQLSNNGQYRKDLYYRLNVFPIEIPALRHRMEDLPHLAAMILGNLNAKYHKGIEKLDPAVAEGLKTYDWPGNIREMENILERAYLLEETDTINTHNLPPEMVIIPPNHEGMKEPQDLTLSQARKILIEEFERDYLVNLMKACHGKINLSAHKAGITPRQLNRLLNRYGIHKKDYRF